MDYVITVRVSDGEKTIEIPWEDIVKDFIDFVYRTADLPRRRAFLTALRIVTSRIRCVFLDRYKKYLIQ